MKKSIILTAAISLMVAIASCGGGQNYREVMKAPEAKFYAGQYKEAAEMLKPYAAKEDKDQLLYLMEAGYMFHIAGDYKLSNTILTKAATIAKLIPVSVTQQVATLLTNQTAANYRGEDFEKVLIKLYAGINYLMMKDYEKARVEFKGVTNELAAIMVEGKPKYKQNIFAKYLTAIAFECYSDLDKTKSDLEYAQIEYRQIQKLIPQFTNIADDLARVDARLESSDPWGQDKGELVMLFQAGKSAIKQSRGKLMEGDMKGNIEVSLRGITLQQGVTIAAILIALKTAENPIPKFEKRSNLASYVQMVINGRTYRSQMMENIEDTAVRNMEDDYTSLKLKVAASIVTKAAVSIAAGIAAKEIAKKMGAGAFSGLIGEVAGAGTGAALFSTMGPDLRCWHTLPANLQVKRIVLDPGVHDMELQYVGHSGQVLLSKNYKITIEKGKKTFFTARSLN